MTEKTFNAKLMETLKEIPNFTTDETAQIVGRGGNRTYKYLNLSTILKTIRPIFEMHGLEIIQTVTTRYNPSDGSNAMQIGIVTTTIFDEQENNSYNSYPFVITGDPQANGSAVTYARRYSLYALLGIFPDKDDDGAAAAQAYKAPVDGISREEANSLYQAATAKNLDFMQLAADVHGSPIHRTSELSARDAAALKQRIDNA